MARDSRSRPTRAPNWRPGERHEAHPARLWLKRLSMSAVALGLIVLFILSLSYFSRPRPIAFAALVVDSIDAGELATPAYASADRDRLASLSWNGAIVPDGSFESAKDLGLTAVDDPLEVLVCYVAAHAAVQLRGDETQVCLLTADIKRSELPEFVQVDEADSTSASSREVDDPNNKDRSSLVPLRKVLGALAKTPARVKIVLLDTPRIHMEPWLSLLQNDWTTTLAEDVRACNDETLWVVCPGATQGASRVDHKHGRSLFAHQVAEVLQGLHDSNENSRVDLGDLKERLTEVCGQAPFIANASSDPVSLSDVALPWSLSSPPPVPVADAEKDDDKKPADPAKPGDKKVATDPAWDAHDALLSLDPKQEITPVDYAPGAWRTLQTRLIWNDWRRQTGAEAGEDLLATEFSAVRPWLEMARNSQNQGLVLDALAPLQTAVKGYQSKWQRTWRKAPSPYRNAVRRRNLLLTRLPDYWRWKAARGEWEQSNAETDFADLSALCRSIDEVGGVDDQARAARLDESTEKKQADALRERIADEVRRAVVEACKSYDEKGEDARLSAQHQQQIEQLLLTALPTAEDRQRLWKVLKETSVKIARGEITPLPPVAAQASCEIALAKFVADFDPSREAAGDAACLFEATGKEGFADLKARLKFTQCLIDFESKLQDRFLEAKAPESRELEQFARAADALVDRDDRVGSIAAIPEWQSKLSVVVEPDRGIDLGSGEAHTFAVTITGGETGKGNEPFLQFTDIPDGLRVTSVDPEAKPSDGKFYGEKLTFQVQYDAQDAAGTDVAVFATANVGADSESFRIPITLPKASVFRLIAFNGSPFVRKEAAEIENEDGSSLDQTWLDAHPNVDTPYSLALERMTEANVDVKVELYQFEKEWDPNQALPANWEELQEVATLLPIQVTLGSGDKIRELKFKSASAEPNPTAEPAATPAQAASPAAPKGTLLTSLRFVAVISELKDQVPVRPQLKWLNINPMHPNRFLVADKSRIVRKDGELRAELSLVSHDTSTTRLAMPDGGMKAVLDMSEKLRKAAGAALIAQGSVTLMQNEAKTPTIELPSSLGDVDDRRLFVDVNKYPRAFMWVLSNDVRNMVPFAGNRLHIRPPRSQATDAPVLTFKPGETINLTLEVDAKAPDCIVEVGLRMTDDQDANRFTPKILRGIRQFRPRLVVDDNGALMVHCEVSDFEVTLDHEGSQGKARIYARMRDANPPAEDEIDLVLDATPPEIQPVTGQPLRHQAEQPLHIKVTVTDALSGPKALQYWVGTPPLSNMGSLPDGLPATSLPPSGDHETRDFTLKVEAVPVALPPRGGQIPLYMRAQDYSGEWSEVNRDPIMVDYVTQPMATSPDKIAGKPRDILVSLVYKRGDELVPCREPVVDLLDGAAADLLHAPPKDHAEGVAPGAVTLRQVPPGNYVLKAWGLVRGVPGAGTKSIEVPDDGADDPIQVQIVLK